MCFSLFSITSLFWEHVSFTKPWDMSWLILKFKILKLYMYLLDISVYIGNILTLPVFCKELNHWNWTKQHFDLNYDTTNVSHSVMLIIVGHLVSHLHFSFFQTLSLLLVICWSLITVISTVLWEFMLPHCRICNN